MRQLVAIDSFETAVCGRKKKQIVRYVWIKYTYVSHMSHVLIIFHEFKMFTSQIFIYLSYLFEMEILL